MPSLPRPSSGQQSPAADYDEKLTQSRNIRRRFEGQWALNLAYMDGKQWTAFDGQRLYEPELEPWRIKFVDNRISPIVRTEIAKLTKTRPGFVARPKTSDNGDIYAAQMAESVLEFLWDELDCTRKLRQALLWSRVTGAGFWKVYWDSGKGDSVDVLVDPQGQPVKDSYGRPLRPDAFQQLPEGIQQQTVAMGEVCVDVRTPMQIFPDTLCGEEGLGAATWIIEEAIQSVEYVKSRYQVELDPDSAASSGMLESWLPGRMEASAPNQVGVAVREFWSKPTSEYPKGKRVVWSKDKLLYEGDNPYPWLPYVMFRGIASPGRFWPDCIVTQLISPQTELNKRKAQIAENAERIGNPALLVSRQSDVEWNGLPGEEIKFNDTLPNSVPTFLQVPEVPGYVREDVARIEASMAEISGQHEATSGSVPAGVTAASAINLLQEADDTRLGPDVADMEEGVSQAAKRVIELVAMYYTDNRVVRLAGEDGAWDIFDFRGAMVNGNTDIKAETGSMLPHSKAAKMAAMQDLLNLALQYGLPLKQRDLRKFFQDYEVGGLERLFADLGEDERQVQNENRRMAIGEAFPINKYDDDKMHIEGHEQFQKSAKYSQLDPQSQMNFDVHVDQHRQRLTSMQIPQQTQLQLPVGSAPTPQNGPPPLPVPSPNGPQQ